MESKEPYSMERLMEIHEYLTFQADSQKALDYEIRMDNLIVVSRTKDTNRFYHFENQIRESTKELLVLIFKGTSRISDKFCFVLKETISTPSIDEQIQEALKREKESMLIRFEMDYLRKKIKDQKQTIKDLRNSLQNVDSGSNNLSKIISDLSKTPALKKLFIPDASNKSDSEITSSSLGSLPDNEVMNLLKHYRTELGEELFQSLLGTILTMAQTPELIPQVRDFISSQNKPL